MTDRLSRQRSWAIALIVMASVGLASGLVSMVINFDQPALWATFVILMSSISLCRSQISDE